MDENKENLTGAEFIASGAAFDSLKKAEHTLHLGKYERKPAEETYAKFVPRYDYGYGNNAVREGEVRHRISTETLIDKVAKKVSDIASKLKGFKGLSDKVTRVVVAGALAGTVGFTVIKGHEMIAEASDTTTMEQLSDDEIMPVTLNNSEEGISAPVTYEEAAEKVNAADVQEQIIDSDLAARDVFDKKAMLGEDSLTNEDLKTVSAYDEKDENELKSPETYSEGMETKENVVNTFEEKKNDDVKHVMTWGTNQGFTSVNDAPQEGMSR